MSNLIYTPAGQVPNTVLSGSVAVTSYESATPLTEDTVTVSNNIAELLLNPAETLAELTVVMPSAPVDGQEVKVTSTQIVTALTVSGNTGQSVLGVPTTITASHGFTMKYLSANTTWYCIQSDM